MISLQTNVDSIGAQNNLNINEKNQSKTIQSLTSGYRINSSGDDAAGLAVANGLRDQITELTQGVSNANTGVAQLQIVDGGLSNISTILDRMKTLATESASGTFTGDRSTLNKEYSGLVSEITRQATNINLNAGGSFNKNLSVYIGGAGSQANAQVNVDLSGASNAVDATSLGLSGSNVLGGGVSLSGNTVNLNNSATSFLAGSGSQSFTFNVMANGTAQTVTATLSGGASGISGSTAVTNLNSQLSQYGITAGLDSNGGLQFSGATAFTAKVGAASAGNATATATSTATNTSNYNFDGGTYSGTANTDPITISTGSGSATYTVNSGDTLAQTIAGLNTQLKNSGLDVSAVVNSAGTGISFQSQSNFSVADGAASPVSFTTAKDSNGNYDVAAPSTTSTSNANAAINAINQAIQNLGLVQGSVGAGENKLQYAINLASSQIANFSTAQSQIRDTDVAAAAANLTKGQVLQQASIAAMSQANSEPQSVLKLLQG
jgi:flagellin